MGIAASSAPHHQAGKLSPRYTTEQAGSPWADQPPASTTRTRRERSPALTERTGRPRSRSHSPNGTSRTGTSLERLNQAHRRRSQQAEVQEIRDRHAGRLRDLERATTARIAQETEAREQVTTERDAERRRYEQEIAQLRADNARREREVCEAREDLAREQADRADEIAQIQYQAAAPTTNPAPNPRQPLTAPGPAVQPMEEGPKSRRGPSRTATSPAPERAIFVNRFSILADYDSETKDVGLPTVARVMLQKSKILEQRGTIDVRGFQTPLQILIDTGAEYSLIDQRFVEKHEVPTNERLEVA
ncbi:MAG: hypothetical protein M1816_005392 [Peltula sp. TS41687]|nr:MAG: hypothetical protein M1816_005392 [Peltula sp. TS41687]